MLIAVEGAPASGCTLFCVKLAQVLQAREKEAVLVVFPEIAVPPAAYLFPLASEGLRSLGEALDSAEIFQERIAAFIHTEKSLPNIGYLGYRPGEKEESYPALTEDRVREFIRAAKALSPFIIADLSHLGRDLRSDPLAAGLYEAADRHIRVLSPTLKSAAYAGADKGTYSLTVLNTPDRAAVYPENEMKKRLAGSVYQLPYSRELAAQGARGELSLHLPPASFRPVLNRLAGELL